MTASSTFAHLSGLRRRAMTSLDAGRKPDGDRFDASAAMDVLYRLASSPDTAADALAVLHELQVHQVELDLQNEDLIASNTALEDALMHETYLFDHAPVGYLQLDAACVAQKVNRAALRLLGMTRVQLRGLSMGNLLTQVSREHLQMMLVRAQQGMVPLTQALHFLPRAEEERVLLATIDLDMAQTGYLVALMSMPAAD